MTNKFARDIFAQIMTINLVFHIFALVSIFSNIPMSSPYGWEFALLLVNMITYSSLAVD